MSGPIEMEFVAPAIAAAVQLLMEKLRLDRDAAIYRQMDLEREHADRRALNAVNSLYESDSLSEIAKSRMEERRQAAVQRREEMLANRRSQKKTSEQAGDPAPDAPPNDPLDDIDFEKAMNLIPDDNELALPLKRTQELPVAATVSREEVTAAIAEMLQLKAGLSQDEFTRQFCAARLEQWQAAVEAFLGALPTSRQPDLACAQAKEFIAQAKALLHDAEEIQKKFTIRNHILAEMITSLQEIGFFVDDPQYDDPANPSGAVLVRARRGGETLEASVDLSETIRSVWDGIHDEEQCKSEFFRYVDEMRQRGIEISSERPDLRERPQLKQQGAKEAPHQRGDARELHHG